MLQIFFLEQSINHECVRETETMSNKNNQGAALRTRQVATVVVVPPPPIGRDAARQQQQ